MAGKIFYYLALPVDVVPEILLELKSRAARVNVVFQSEEGHNYRISADSREEVKLCSMDTAIEDLKARVDEMAAESLGIRSEVLPMALHLDMADEIPTPGNGKTWPSLVQRIHSRMHDIPGPTIAVSESGSGSKGN
jgi:hypothetical protein